MLLVFASALFLSCGSPQKKHPILLKLQNTGSIVVLDRIREAVRILQNGKETKEKPKDSIASAGPITGRKFNIYDDAYDDDISPEDLENHVPVQAVYPLDEKNFTVLSAADLKTRRRLGNLPHLYANPMHHLDYRIYETLLKSTFIGALADAFVKYLVGSGFKPELILINPSDDKKSDKKKIEANQDIITNLLKIDNQIEVNDDAELDASFKQKIIAAIVSMLMYNRGALIFEYEKPIKVNGTVYPDIPSHLIYAHARDLGMIDINPETRRLRAVQWAQSVMNSFIPVRSMIYLWNPITSSKIYNSWFYGTSILSPLISSSKLIRNLLSETFPAMAKSTWAGVFFLIAKNDGNTKESKMAEYKEIATNSTPGAPNVLIKDPEDVKLENVDYEPKIAELRELFESMIKLCISIMGLPQVGFYDEAAANRSTLVGKIQLTMRTTIEPMREWIGESIAQQWHNRWFKLLYKGKPEILDTFRIKLSWADLHISEWYDSIEAALELDSRKQLKDAEFGEMVGIDNYPAMTKEDVNVTPGGSGGKKMSFTDSESGNKFEMKQKRGDGSK